MKKSILLLLFLFLATTLMACNENSAYSDFEKFILDLDSTITADMDLPQTYENTPVSYYYNDEKIEKIEFPYSNKDIEITIDVVLENDDEIKVSKQILVKKSKIIYDLYISTENQQEITSKDDYIRGNLSLEDDGPFSKDELGLRIRGRGNSTWEYPKKPYKIKFDERQSLLGMAAAKEYVLLAEYNDKSLMRNYLAQYFTQFLNVDRFLETRYVNLHVNEVYQGLYLLTEQVEVDSNRLSIDESERSDGGFLIELEADDRVNQEGVMDIDWFKVDGRNFVIKSPDMEDYTSDIVDDKIDYMKTYLNEFLISIENDTYEDYIDVDNFIDYFILAELFKQVDIGYSSVYTYKDVDQKLKMGPSWDFDISSGNGDYYDYGPEGYWVDYNPWFRKLIQKKSFETQYTARFKEVMDLYFDDLLFELDYVSNLLYPYAIDNFATWTILDEYVWPNPQEMLEANTYLKQIIYLKNYLIQRESWLEDEMHTYGYYLD
ncbi:CotH kinase family protein [Mariniplasma anaerobium]|uniref:CotH protein n=1 Tax=Mariniplasma anaerobium TaxID=2735436 RepID=A0A7U9TIP5_9MOLU|nr:CotH kinase family protein [Mariniplasma anaerobium]BCR36411.1 hypothetical protein MPAN_013040 [Mariniplasma anaerobium]